MIIQGFAMENSCVMYLSIPKPSICSHYVACLDGQMPHLLELQRGSNLSPSRHVKATVQNFFPCVKTVNSNVHKFCNKQLAAIWFKIWWFWN